MLSGFKTYIVGGGAIVGAIFAVVNGYMTVEQAADVVVNGAIGMTIRHALARGLGA